MKVSIDGGETWEEMDRVDIRYDDVFCDNNDQETTVTLKCTDEGVIRDVEDSEGENIATSCEFRADLADNMFGSVDEAM